MDYLSKIEEVKQELLSLGFTEDKYNELLELAIQEAIDITLVDLREKDDVVVQELEQNLKKDIAQEEDAKSNIDLIFTTTYGEKAEEMKSKLVFEYLETALEETKKAKDLFERYQSGDPTAVATINANKDNPEIEELATQL